MAVATQASQIALYKRLYPKGIADVMYKKSIALADVKKKTDFGGEGAYINIATSGTSGGSSDFETALANQGPSTQKRFFITHRKEYQIATVDGLAIATSNTDKMAVMKVLKTEMDKANYKFTLALSSKFFGNAGGSLGQISATSNVATTTITLAALSDAVKFEIGDWIQTASDNGSGSSPAGTNGGATQAQIVNMDRSTGTLTLSSAWSTAIPGTAAGHFIFRTGDYANAFTGLGGWNPIAAPTPGDSFFGMDRSVGDVVRQAGARYSGNTGGSYEDTVLNASTEAAMLTSRLPRTYVSPRDFNKLAKELGSKRIVDASNREGYSGFKGIQMFTPAGVTEVVSDPFMVEGFGRMIDPDDVTLMTAGDCPGPLNWGGAQSTQVLANADAVQFRIGAYGNYGYEMNNIPMVFAW